MKKITNLITLCVLFSFNGHSQNWAMAEKIPGSLYSSNSSFVDADKNFYVVGSFNSDILSIGDVELPNSSEDSPNPEWKYYDSYLAKFDADGNFLYAKTFSGSKNEALTSVTYDGNAFMYVTGYYSGTTTIGTDTYETTSGDKAFIAKLDLEGNVIWSKSFNFFGGPILKFKNDYLYLAAAYGGNSYTLDNLTAPSIDYVAVVSFMDKTFVAKLDTSGNPLWIKSSTYNGTSSISDPHRIGTQPRGMAVDNDGNVFVSGVFHCPSTTFGTQTIAKNASLYNSNLFLAKYDSEGNFGWASTAVTSSAAHSRIFDLVTDNLNNVYLTGNIYNSMANFSGTSVNLLASGSFLAKYNTSGAVGWVKIGRTSTDASPNVSNGMNSFDKLYIDSANNIHVSGTYAKRITFGDGLTFENEDFSNRMFSIQYDGNGIASNFYQLSDTQIPQYSTVQILDVSDGAYSYSGLFTTPSLTLGSFVLEQTGTGGQHFIGKRQNDLGIANFSNTGFIYPNPTENIVNISNFEENTTCSIIDITGKKIKELVLTEPFFSVEDIQSGIYILQLQNQNTTKTIKLIKK
ncbi:hypothetical protein J2X31_002870 [Flavobacterium arsenatis]|uniref:Secretion system C-terminal sorting domain-containing protein n=1 Tax=Flavobacterium arsenatis TaxID=1484332 RepID=A0ABU1TSI6_9FLAO|nr:T9SS type A sorting domain-containing protein [Flavobacterium arsenatis]MDR6968844.1 hypothetical protein [Flavobacterium arsenatis]